MNLIKAKIDKPNSISPNKIFIIFWIIAGAFMIFKKIKIYLTNSNKTN